MKKTKPDPIIIHNAMLDYTQMSYCLVLTAYNNPCDAFELHTHSVSVMRRAGLTSKPDVDKFIIFKGQNDTEEVEDWQEAIVIVEEILEDADG
jgi:hypothetical protein